VRNADATDEGRSSRKRSRTGVAAWPKERIDSATPRRHARTMWETVDPEGRRVVLTVSTWRHIVERHDDMRPFVTQVVDTVARPDDWVAGRRPIEQWFYRRDVGPSSWIKVVVHFEGREGRIVTAFPRRRFP
jgi:hypothetical protein